VTRHDEDTAEFDEGFVVRTTEAAVLIEVDGEEEIWVPKSQLREGNDLWEEGDSGSLVVTWWFAEKSGLV
jgi:hypothetical protein